LTSANRAHHASHLAHYKRLTGTDFWDCRSIVEWGGGYGDMARIIRRMNPSVTYTIIDLPELLALQYVYLSSIFGEGAVNVIGRNDSGVTLGKINLIASQSVYDTRRELECDGFLSTWALTESPRRFQMAVLERGFFGASSLLLGVMNNENNYLKERVGFAKTRAQVPIGYGVSEGNEYWVK
jgi:hypothetical protein